MIVPLHRFDPRVVDKYSNNQFRLLFWILKQTISNGADEVTFLGVGGSSYRVTGLLRDGLELEELCRRVLSSELNQVVAMSFPDLDQSFYDTLEQLYLLKYMSEAK
jgi:tRNA A37 methylthiotransferase MiaB